MNRPKKEVILCCGVCCLTQAIKVYPVVVLLWGTFEKKLKLH